MDLEAVAARFALGAVVEVSTGPVARGRTGKVWRLGTTEGSWAVKVAFGELDERAVADAAAFQELARASGVPTPPVRRTPSGEAVAEVAGLRVRVHGWVELLPPDPLVDPAAVGRVLAAIHRLDVPIAGTVDAWSSSPVGAGRWDELIAELGRVGAPFAGQLAALRDELVALEGWMVPPATLRRCHRDLWADNLLPMADGGLCVIDWDESGPADPSMELAAVLFEFGRTDPVRARALVEAYRTAGGPGTVARRGDFTMLIAQLGHITALAAADWLEPNRRTPDRSDAEAWVREVLEEPHTRAVLGGLLAAVTEGRGGPPGPLPGRSR